MLLACTTIAGCKVSDSMFLNAQTKAAFAELEKTKKELKQSQAQMEAARVAAKVAQDAVQTAKTDEEKAEAAAMEAAAEEQKAKATAALLAAVDKAEAAEVQLDKALESKAPSPIESLASLASSFGLPWLLTLATGAAATYKHVRAKNGDKARDAVLETVEEAGETEEGKKFKEKLATKFEQKGVTPYVDAGLRILGFLRKSTKTA